MAVVDQVEQFRLFLVGEGLKFTRQRRAIVDVFYRANKHLSLTDILDRARVEEPSIGYATVYRTMRLLTEGGLAVQHQFGDGQVRFEPRHEGDHHDHIICTTCGQIFEFEDSAIEALQEAIASNRDFRVLSHKHEIYAECTRVGCTGRRAGERPMAGPLAEPPAGD